MENRIKSAFYKYGDQEIMFELKTNLTVAEKIKFVNSVIDTVVSDKYYPFIRDLVFDYTILSVFTDVKIDGTDDENGSPTLEEIELFLSDTNVIEVVKANISEELLEELSEAIDVNIRFKTGINKNSLTDSLMALIKTTEKKIESIDMGGMIDLAEKINGIKEDLSVDNLMEAFAKTPYYRDNRANILEKKNKQIRDLLAQIDSLKDN